MSGKFLECSSESASLDSKKGEVHALKKRDFEKPAVRFNDGNIKSPETLNSNWTNKIIYMNCSTSNVNCMIIMCDLSALKSLQDTGRIVIKHLLDVDKLKGNCTAYTVTTCRNMFNLHFSKLSLR